MSIIPGVSTKQRLKIQNKLDKIISQDFLNICPHFAQNNDFFNLQLSQNLLSKENAKFNANLSKNFHSKTFNTYKIEHMKELNSFLTKPHKLLNKLFNTFTISELMILLNHLNVFVKNKEIRKFFPTIRSESLENMYQNQTTNESNQKKFLPLLIPYITNSEGKKKVKKDLMEEVKSISLNQRQKDIEKELINEKNKKVLSDIIKESNKKLLNIRNFIKNEKLHINHPMIEYYMNQRKKKLNKSSSTPIIFNKPNVKKYKELFDKNVKKINYLNSLKSNLIKQTNLIKKYEKEENFIYKNK